MPTFPKTDAGLLAQVVEMVNGYIAHGADFPHVDLAGLEGLLTGMNTTAAGVNAATEALRVAVQQHQAARDALAAKAKKELAQSEVDTNNDPVKLNYIHWAPRKAKSLLQPPGEPTNFRATEQGAGTVSFEWRHPDTSVGGKWRFYRLDRRQLATGGGFTDWEEVWTGTTHAADLLGQPRGIQLEYRVLAVNSAGAATGATVPIVL